jgi:nucleotide-binding universal stress UspA family protein
MMMDATMTLGQRLLVPLDGSTTAAQALPAARLLAAPEAEVLLFIVRADAAGGESTLPAIQRVVVPLDGSAQAARALIAAQSLATRCGAPIGLLTAIDPAAIVPPATAGVDAAAAHDALAAAEAAAHQLLEQTGTQLLRAGQPASAWPRRFCATRRRHAIPSGRWWQRACHPAGGEAYAVAMRCAAQQAQACSARGAPGRAAPGRGRAATAAFSWPARARSRHAGHGRKRD